jgi:hypothetical protein
MGTLIEIFVRFANESTYHTRIKINPKNIKNPLVFPNEVFFDIDDMRVAISRKDWELIIKNK